VPAAASTIAAHAGARGRGATAAAGSAVAAAAAVTVAAIRASELAAAQHWSIGPLEAVFGRTIIFGLDANIS
jgi:hypothetical protein